MGKYYNGPTADELRSPVGTKEKEELRKKISEYVEKCIKNADAHGHSRFVFNEYIFGCSVKKLDWLSKELIEAGCKVEIEHKNIYCLEADTCMPNTAYIVSWE
jgi:hypothetical protein